MKLQIRKLFLFAFLAAAAGLFSAPLDIDSFFEAVNIDGMPARWTLHDWSGYHPLANIEVVSEEGFNFLRVWDIKGRSGMGVRNIERLPVAAGDTIRAVFKLRGKGKGKVELYKYTANGQWNSQTVAQPFELKPEWQSMAMTFNMDNGPAGETASFNITFCADKGSEFELADVRLEHTASKYSGDAALPKDWTLFGPVDPKYQPTEAELTSIPETLAGVAPAPAQRLYSRIDFRPLLGSEQEKCGWAYAEFESPIEQDFTIGAGADWWMELYLNGEKLFDTTKYGNVVEIVAMDNHVKTVRLPRGRNVIAAKLISGAASADLFVAGPNDLRSVIANVRLAKVSWIEDFDGKSAACSGSPELITGFPTPGLLEPTGQAVFTTQDTLKITAPETAIEVPKESGRFAATGLRIQYFGRETRRDSAVAFALTDAGSSGTEVTAEIYHRADSEQLEVLFRQNGEVINSANIDYAFLPADFAFGVSRAGQYAFFAKSLVTSNTQCWRGDAAAIGGTQTVNAEIRFSASDETELVADNFLIGELGNDTGENQVPFITNVQKTFDPVAEGWPLVFEDDFNAEEYDQEKWILSNDMDDSRVSLRDGKAIISADWNAEHTKITTSGLRSKEMFVYGYFEARVKFRKESGWWAAFWLCAPDIANPFLNSFEIDIFEDYYLRPMKPGAPYGDKLDHNLHITSDNVLKSWNYGSTLPGSLDDFYVIGCKWTPFEISFYLNGKIISSSANHSNYSSVTFDPFHHGMGIVPLRIILSGQNGKSGGDPAYGKFPEDYEIDWVRAYAYKQPSAPSVTLPVQGTSIVPMGETLTFEPEVAPGPSGAPITGVYLFDSGFLLDYKTEPPYNFRVSLTEEYYNTTDYVKPGRQGGNIRFRPGVHAYAVAVQDADGEVSCSEVQTVLIADKAQRRSTPYQGKAAVIPGEITPANYDEGGQNVAYLDYTPGNQSDKTGTTRPGEDFDVNQDCIGHFILGEWVNYTVDIQEAGSYTAVLHYGTWNEDAPKGVAILLDGEEIGYFKTPRGKNFAARSLTSTLPEVILPAGRHELRLLLLRSSINIGGLEFKKN